VVLLFFALKQTESSYCNDNTQISSSNKPVKQGGEIKLNCLSLAGDVHALILHEKRGLCHVKLD